MWAVALQSMRAGDWREGEIVRAVRSVGPAAWGYALAVFWIVFAIMFTVFLTKPYGLWDGIHDGLDYWLHQQPVARGGSPGTSTSRSCSARSGRCCCSARSGPSGAAPPDHPAAFLIWAFVCSLAVYSWASERFAWLVLHPLLPPTLLAGIGVQALWLNRPRRLRVAAGVVIAACLAYTLYATFTVNALHGANPREWLVSTQSSVDVKRVADRVEDLDRRARAKTGSR